MNNRRAVVLVSLLIMLLTMAADQALTQDAKAPEKSVPWGQSKLTPAVASNFASVALRCISREYPNKPDHVVNDEKDVLTPQVMHPAFYGCYDWHSSVHGHWMLIRLLRLFPDLPEAAQIRAALNANLSERNVRIEVQYLDQPGRKSFERTYGWAWLLKLAQELRGWNDAQGQQWSRNLEPLTQAIVARYMDFLPRQTYPIRTGVHPNTAFGIAFALDYARDVRNEALEKMLVERSLTYYGDDRDAPVSWEPGGEDFFSPGLMEADLMRRVLNRDQFEKWFRRFMPGLVKGTAENLLKPAVVSDRTDPKIVHLDGLNLSRAWCMTGIASALPLNEPARNRLIKSAETHANDGLAHVASGNDEGEHWLASFAVYLLSQGNALAGR
ncbi:DUF2891 domain-containing protein [bacterium]|nr:MAG: DUF2891 domain-containing protein [bacterium]